jgi:hypothetical protein
MGVRATDRLMLEVGMVSGLGAVRGHFLDYSRSEVMIGSAVFLVLLVGILIGLLAAGRHGGGPHSVRWWFHRPGR